MTHNVEHCLEWVVARSKPRREVDAQLRPDQVPAGDNHRSWDVASVAQDFVTQSMHDGVHRPYDSARSALYSTTGLHEVEVASGLVLNEHDGLGC